VREAVPVHFGELGLALPWKVLRALREHPDAFVLVVGAAIGLATAVHLARVARPDALRAGRVGWPLLIAMGFVLFGVGYGVTLMTWEIGFHATGPNNRTANAAAIGVGWVFASVIGWICSRMPSERVRGVAFATLIGLLAAGCTILTGTIAGFWERASDRQDVVIRAVLERFPTLPAGSTLLLDGLCPFAGPAPVFATGWDTTGMLRLTYGDRTLNGDVVKPNTEATPEGVRTLLFDDVINVYPYGDDLIVLHLGTGESTRLTSRDVARAYLEDASAATRVPCPPYTDGDGAPIF
jgi:hypothetical protein